MRINPLGLLVIYGLFLTSLCCRTPDLQDDRLSRLDRQLLSYVNKTFSIDKYKIFDGISIERKEDGEMERICEEESRSMNSLEDYIKSRFEDYTRTHVVSIKIPETGRFFKFATGKSSFMTGFGLGFLAFGLKKLLLPLFIGAQIVKSVLIAMFLPSILGSLGKLVGKGLSQVSGVSGASGHQQPIDDFDFKDTTSYTNNDGEYAAPADGMGYNYNDPATTTSTDTKQAMNRFSQGGAYKRIYMQQQSDNYYLRQPNKHHDYKIFHKIPSSSLLLTTYDPFYSPLLSRLDSVFQQLGLGEGKGHEIERCRERIICLMYANPAKYAPYSNLVSAQLSRELNELRKPSSDNPEILRFFRYMKAAKDGQEDSQCLAHGGCPSLHAAKPSPAMLTTYNHINKLVQARRLQQ